MRDWRGGGRSVRKQSSNQKGWLANYSKHLLKGVLPVVCSMGEQMNKGFNCSSFSILLWSSGSTFLQFHSLIVSLVSLLFGFLFH